MSRLVQLPLFGAQYVHLGHQGRVIPDLVCVMCGVSLPFAWEWGADCCPGAVVTGHIVSEAAA